MERKSNTESTPKKQKVRILAVKPDYKLAPYFLTPTFDDKKKVFRTGQENLTEAERKKEPLIIDSNESYPVRHMMILDLNVRADEIMYNFFLQKDDVIAKSKSAINPGVHRFYIENREEEATMAIKDIDMEYDALTLIKKLNLEGMNDLARLLGSPIKDMGATQVEAFLKKKAKSNPHLIITALQDNDRDIKIILNKLVDGNVITKKDGGKYYNGDNLIGVNEFYAVEYLKKKENSDIVAQWMHIVEESAEQLES